MFYNYRPDGLSEKGMSNHTQEPWVLFEVGDRVKHFCPASEKEKTSILTVTLEDGTAFGAVYSEDDARRIVACVNACAGLPTEQLEASPLGGVLNGVAGLIAQRDQLLAALQDVRGALSSVNSGHQHQITVNDEPAYWQTGEWVRWILDEVLPGVDAAINTTKAE